MDHPLAIADDVIYIIKYQNSVNANYIMSDIFSVVPDAGQIRAARAFLRWSARDLAREAELSVPTIQRIEAQTGPVQAMMSTMGAIISAFRQHGITFLKDDGGGVGVRYLNPQPTLGLED